MLSDRLMRWAALMVTTVAVMALGACSYAPGGAGSGASTAATVSGGSLVPATDDLESPTINPSSGDAESCDIALQSISDLVIVNNGEPTVSGAFNVTGLQLANYLETIAERGGGFSFDSPWRSRAEESLALCFLDGSFTSTLPGPPGHDTTADRAIVIVADGQPELYAAGKQDDIPVEDPTTLQSE